MAQSESWQLIGIGNNGRNDERHVILDGVSPWEYDWKPVEGSVATVKTGGRTCQAQVYGIQSDMVTIRFAARPVGGGVFEFWQPREKYAITKLVLALGFVAALLISGFMVYRNSPSGIPDYENQQPQAEHSSDNSGYNSGYNKGTIGSFLTAVAGGWAYRRWNRR